MGGARKVLIVLTIVMLPLLVVSEGVRCEEAAGDWGKLGLYGRSYDPATEGTFTVSVVDIIKIKYHAAHVSPGCYCVALAVKDQEAGKLRTLYLGPCSYMKRRGCNIQPGDVITVTGSVVEIEGRPLILAKVINKNGKILQIRNDQGRLI